jgi:RNA polymerase sigma-70 factor, ECF subfamily
VVLVHQASSNVQEHTNPEHAIREAFDSGSMERAASALLSAYGHQILSFITSRLRSQSDAQEVFSTFAEDLWVGLPGFSWRCSARTWSYTLARNAVVRFVTAPQQRRDRNVPLSCPGSISGLVARFHSTTPHYQRTDVKAQFRSLREGLDPEDQMLLVLRVDRNLPWRDLALAMSGDTELDEPAVARESARLRKAFERIKRELKRQAQEAGLLPQND